MSAGPSQGMALWRPDDGLGMQHLRRAFAMPVVGLMLLQTALAVVHLPAHGADPLGIACLGGYLLALGWGLTRRLTPWLGLWATGAGLAAAGLPASLGDEVDAFSLLGPGVAIAVLVGVLRPWAACIAGLASIAPATWLRLEGGMSLLDATEVSVFNAALLISGLFFFTILVGHARQADRASENHHRRVLETARETSHREATARARWTLHDEIISALRTVVTCDDPGLVRDACDRAVAATRVFEATEESHGTERPERPECSGSLGALRAATDLGPAIAVGVPLRVDVDEAGLERTGDLPLPVAHDLVAAAREALRNVERHAGVDTAEVTLRGLDPGLQIDVIDSGCGFTTGQAAGFGLNSSIRGRLALHGGESEVTSAPGAGTRVRLSWRPGPSSAYPPLLTHTPRRPGGWLLAPLCLAQACIALAQTWDSTDRAALWALLVTLELVALIAMWRFSRRTPRLAEQAAWSAGLSLAILGGLQLVPPGALTNSDSWMVALAQLPLTLVAFYAPRSLPLVTLPPLLAVSLAILLDPASPVGQSTLAINAVVMPAVVAACCGTRVQKYAALAARTAAETAATEAHEARLAAADEATSRQLRRTRAVTVPWLEAVAHTGELPDHSTRAMARVLAAESRDELDSPGAYTFRTAQPLANLRMRGGMVTLRGRFEAEHRRRADDLLPGLFARLGAEHRVIVTAGPHDLRVSIVPGIELDLPDLPLSRGSAWQVDSDTQLTIISTGLDPEAERLPPRRTRQIATSPA